MAKIKMNTINDSTLIRFEVVQYGEVFMFKNMPYIKLNAVGLNAINPLDGYLSTFEDDDLVTYVKKAELNLTI